MLLSVYMYMQLVGYSPLKIQFTAIVLARQDEPHKLGGGGGVPLPPSLLV